MLLIDELDRTDEPFEAFLLEVLSDFQVTIPELGTIRAAQPPIVVLTSNRTREIHDALKRRCLYHWVDYPDAERELAILRVRAPGVDGAAVAARSSPSSSGCATRTCSSSPASPRRSTGRAPRRARRESSSTPEVIADTLGALLKYQDDIAQMQGSEAAKILAEINMKLDHVPPLKRA